MPHLFSMQLHIAPQLPLLADISPDSFAEFVHGLIASCRGALLNIVSAHYTLAFAAFLYVGIIFSIGITPDQGKFRYAVFFVTLITGLMYLLDKPLGYAATRFSEGVMLPALSFAVPLSVLFFLLAIVFSAVVSAFKGNKKTAAKPATA
jgi:hypothetical protein